MTTYRNQHQPGDAMRIVAMVSLALGALAMAGLTVTSADAQTRKKREVVIKGQKARSFLDSGRVVPVGSLSNYVAIGTTFNKMPYDAQRGRYGGETLPRLWDLPGR